MVSFVCKGERKKPMNLFSFKRMTLFLLIILLIGGLSLSCTGGNSSNEGDGEQMGDQDPVDSDTASEEDLIGEGDMDSLTEEDPSEMDTDPDPVDDDPMSEEDQPTDQVENVEEDLVDPPVEVDNTETEQPDPTSLWMIFEGFVSGGGHAASSQYKLQYGRLGGSAVPGAAQSTHYRISNGSISGR